MKKSHALSPISAFQTVSFSAFRTRLCRAFTLRRRLCFFPNNQEPLTNNPVRGRGSSFQPNNQQPITYNPLRRRLYRVNASAFTLIELLVVISIIIILMGLLFPAFKGVQDQAKKTQAKNDISQIVTAVNAYYADYGLYPLNSAQAGGNADTVYGDPNGSYSSAELCFILRAVSGGKFNQNNALNSRQIVYLNAPNAKDSQNPKSGIAIGTSNVTNATGETIAPGSFVDPWGSEYVTFIDGDYDGDITTGLGYFYNDYKAGNVHVKLGVAACSLGKDGKWGTNGDGKAAGSDDVISWQ